MTPDEVVKKTRTYIKSSFLYARPNLELADDADLLEEGIIDSMGVMELLEFIQEEFGVEIDDDDITEENLGTIGAIGRFISGKLAATT